MAKTSMIVKSHRPQKFKVREYTRCERCDAQILFYVNTKSAVFASENWLIKVKFLESKRPVGRKENPS